MAHDQLDVLTAFLYGVMKEQVFCVIPEGVNLDSTFDCLELVKSIYGLKQASRVWNETFDEYVCSIGFQASYFDPCLYIKTSDGHCVLVLVDVKDVLMADSGKYSFVLGIELLDGGDGSVTLCQRHYVDDILKRFGMEECKAVASPVDVSSRLMSSSTASKIVAKSLLKFCMRIGGHIFNAPLTGGKGGHETRRSNTEVEDDINGIGEPIQLSLD
uniref:Reverse transcriptase Ty1/copia-type domain-containing protein n=2 Tax=Peronospora matthiolae TaxID=2874970 RepID=A0AAV1VKA4_9STRA